MSELIRALLDESCHSDKLILIVLDHTHVTYIVFCLTPSVSCYVSCNWLKAEICSVCIWSHNVGGLLAAPRSTFSTLRFDSITHSLILHETNQPCLLFLQLHCRETACLLASQRALLPYLLLISFLAAAAQVDDA